MDRISLLTIALVLALAALVTALTVGPRFALADTLFSDKVQHALGFGGIIAPAAFLRPRWLWVLAPAAIAFGGLIEVAQAYVGRDAELSDWAADIVGVIAASTTAILLRDQLARRGLLRGL
ncbi:teicoplanin resistance protein VanZ [Salipiger mangrovisoli]|uniref:Teicoplanin resistance protein VanZ n=1 Tax=Salipiger mangrovisoli TaxID=2865933 RepID=A0ABR9X8D6_9RHOB|nr:teicoplanin resistance protein VanZ [Salipiger mangrovisoli]MBE9639712.1 teicoplanin resistance protein VanZ [Salipiger mangrovisoli]